MSSCLMDVADPIIGSPLVEYRDIPGFPAYRAGDDGSIWTCRVCGSNYGRLGEWKKLKLLPVSDTGRFKVALRRDGKTLWRAVHRLVLETFVGPCPEGMEACHRDDDQSNNRLENLRWDTHISNCVDRTRNGIGLGMAKGNSKLTDEDVRRIRAMRASGVTYARIASEYGVSVAVIHGIISGKRWTHVV